MELINILRPTLAVARFVPFAAVALEQHPQWRRIFADGDHSDLEPFVQEVRRFFPFFPAVPGRVREPFEWRRHHFREGDWVILDLYGTGGVEHRRAAQEHSHRPLRHGARDPRPGPDDPPPPLPSAPRSGVVVTRH